MSTMPISSQRATQLPTAGMVDTNLEVVVIPVSDVDVSTLTELLRETEKHHGPYEASAPKHHWSGWYAAYIVARERGNTPEEAVKEAARHVEGAAQTKPA